MKTSQLMFGDLVMYNGRIGTVKVLQRKYVRLEIYGVTCINIGWYAADEIEPVPLTEEILEKNGWTLLANFGEENYWSENGEFSPATSVCKSSSSITDNSDATSSYRFSKTTSAPARRNYIKSTVKRATLESWKGKYE